MSARRWFWCEPSGGCRQWHLYVYPDHMADLGHMEGDYVVDDFGTLIKLAKLQPFDDSALHEYDDASLWLFWPESVLEACGQRRPAPPPPPPRVLTPVQAAELRKIERKLEAWELPHLRELAAAQAEQIEALQAQLEAMTRRCESAEASLDFWHDHASDLRDRLHESGAGQVALTLDGQLLVQPPQPEPRPS